MKRAMLEELLASATEPLEHAQGKRELRTTELPPVPAPVSASQVRQLRRRLNASQAVFARYLNVSTKLVAGVGGRSPPTGWAQGRSTRYAPGPRWCASPVRVAGRRLRRNHGAGHVA